MREYKFRGKEADTGKWVYGFYLEQDTYNLGSKNTKRDLLMKNAGIIVENSKCTSGTIIYKETLGQYTGLKDQNMKEIYEGDIVLIDAYTYTEPEFSEEYLVEYNELLGMWELKNLEDNKDIKTFEDLNGWYKLDIKLLGNEWDNPELLEKGE